MEEMNIDQKIYDALAKLIHSDSSPVGIDAKKTHVLILYKLEELARRLDAIEEKMKAS